MKMKKVLCVVFALILALSLLTGCKKTISTTTTETVAKQENEKTEAPTMNYESKSTDALLNIEDIEIPSYEGVDDNYQQRDPQAGDTVAILHTSYGDIAFRLFKEATPLAYNNFVALAEAGRYDNTIFHRVISNFMIQGGDYTNYNGTGGESAYGMEFKNETTEYLKNITGAVAMANRGADTNGSQFYINQVDNNYLDGSYTVFGQVYDGMDVVDAIASVDTDPSNNRPLVDVVLESVDIVTYE